MNSLPKYHLERRESELTDFERSVYEWQIWIRDLGEAGQQRLKNSTVFISRVGGLGGQVAYQLAAAGIGRLILAHAGNVKPSDLNRQLLMTEASIGTPRIESATRRLHELNPRLEIVGYNANVNRSNAERMIAQADIIVDCAPLFEERFEMNKQSVQQRKPMVECAMYDLEGSLTSFSTGATPCLSCLTPTPPSDWKRQFPVLGAVSGTVGCLAAMEAIKILTGIGKPLYGTLLTIDLRSMEFRRFAIARNPECPVCGEAT